jgi:2-polyprenyl-3-methyl-5-hydroxy-6-metoxy-1,4-benzoquinol methylase
MNLTKKISNNQYLSKSFQTSRLVQASYRLAYKKFINSIVKESDRILDIGFGYGFLKPLVEEKKGVYTGIEGNQTAVNYAQRTYGKQGYVLGFFPEDMPSNKKFNIVISLTTIDQVDDKVSFIKGLMMASEENAKIYLTVRNKSSFVGSSGAGYGLQDLSLDDWVSLFSSYQLEINKVTKMPRPLMIGGASWH